MAPEALSQAFGNPCPWPFYPTFAPVDNSPLQGSLPVYICGLI